MPVPALQPLSRMAESLKAGFHSYRLCLSSSVWFSVLTGCCVAFCLVIVEGTAAFTSMLSVVTLLPAGTGGCRGGVAVSVWLSVQAQWISFVRSSGPV